MTEKRLVENIYNFLKLIESLDDDPRANVPGYGTKLAPKEREQLDRALANAEELLNS